MNYESLRNKQETKLKDNQIEMQKILAGKTTMSSLFSKGSKEEKVSKIEKEISSVICLIFLYYSQFLFSLKQKSIIYSSFAI